MINKNYNSEWSGDMSFEGEKAVQSSPLLGIDDDSSFALEILLTAWAEGDAHGVGGENMAYAALFTAMSSLVSQLGEENAARVARGLERRVQVGEFSMHRTRQ